MVTSGSVRIWWDTSVQAYRLVTPFSRDFVDSLKQLVPVADRSWDPSTKIWTISERMLDPVTKICELAFKSKPTVITKAQSQQASAPPSVGKASLDSVIVQFFKLLPEEAARAAYRKAATVLHPDAGGSMEAMSTLNAAWTRLEAELWKVKP